MTQKTTAQPSASLMLRETQNYRTSLEALMSVGRSLLLTPSLEDDSATSFKVLAENVLEQADHQADLQVVDGVTEPQAQVELIMQDVLTPRLTEVEAIENALIEKAELDEPVPFTTRDSETSASMEAMFNAEVLGLYHENAQLVGRVASMEGMTPDVLRPMVIQLATRVSESLPRIGISMEDLEQTQVIGEMQDAVTRIETLVEKARESADEIAESARSAAAQVGSEGGDPMGDLIEQHRADRPTGANLDANTTTGTVETNIPGADAQGDDLGEGGAVGDDLGDGSDGLAGPGEGDDGLGDDGLGDGSEGGDGSDEGLGDGTEGDGTDGLDDGGAGGDDLGGDDTGLDDAAGTEGDDLSLDDGSEGGDGSDTGAEGTEGDDLGDGTDGADAGEDGGSDPVTDPDNIGDDAGAGEGEEGNEEEEDEDDGEPSIESDTNPVIFEEMSRRPQEEVVAATPILTELMNWFAGYDLLTEKGQAALATGVDGNFVLDSSMITTGAAEVLVRHYDTWINGSIRDGRANITGLSMLMGI